MFVCHRGWAMRIFTDGVRITRRDSNMQKAIGSILSHLKWKGVVWYIKEEIFVSRNLKTTVCYWKRY